MKLDVLAFGAHPDDIDIAVGGTLAKCVSQGYKVGLVDLTGGERGTRGSAEIRRTELQNAASILGLAARENLDLGDTQVVISRPNQVKVVEAVRKFRPQVVILPPNDLRHPDHTNAERLVFEGCYFSGLKNFEGHGEPHRPFKVLRVHRARSETKPSFVVDITDLLEKKIQAIAAFASQFPASPNEKGLLPLEDMRERVTLRARWYGQLIGKKYGEAFVQEELMEIGDIVKLPVPSM